MRLETVEENMNTCNLYASLREANSVIIGDAATVSPKTFQCFIYQRPDEICPKCVNLFSNTAINTSEQWVRAPRRCIPVGVELAHYRRMSLGIKRHRHLLIRHTRCNVTTFHRQFLS